MAMPTMSGLLSTRMAEGPLVASASWKGCSAFCGGTTRTLVMRKTAVPEGPRVKFMPAKSNWLLARTCAVAPVEMSPEPVLTVRTASMAPVAVLSLLVMLPPKEMTRMSPRTWPLGVPPVQLREMSPTRSASPSRRTRAGTAVATQFSGEKFWAWRAVMARR